MPDPKPARLARATDNTPGWARALHGFYDQSFNVKSGKELEDSLRDFVGLTPEEQNFHIAHLLFRVGQGVEAVHLSLGRIEDRLAAVEPPNLAPLKHLGPMRRALEEISSFQERLRDAAFLEGDNDDDEEPEEETGDEQTAPGGEDPDFIYAEIPEREPERKPRRPPTQPPQDPPPPTRRAEPRAPRGPDPLEGDLVPSRDVDGGGR